jgi:hypothetical protein
MADQNTKKDLKNEINNLNTDYNNRLNIVNSFYEKRLDECNAMFFNYLKENEKEIRRLLFDTEKLKSITDENSN